MRFAYFNDRKTLDENYEYEPLGFGIMASRIGVPQDLEPNDGLARLEKDHLTRRIV